MPTLQLPGGNRMINTYPFPGAHYPKTGDPAVDHRLVDGFLGQLNQWSFGQAHRYILQEDIEKNPAIVARKLVELTKFPTTYRVLQFSKALAGGSGSGGNVSANPIVRKAGVALMGNEHVANYFPHLPENRDTLSNLIGSMAGLWSGGLCPRSSKPLESCFSSQLHDLNETQIRSCWSDVHKCFDFRTRQFKERYTPALRKAFPTGSYANEGDYFEPDWQNAFWGGNYPSLRAIKTAMDPQGVFVCRHCVGSEEWTDDGNCRLDTGKHQHILV